MNEQEEFFKGIAEIGRTRLNINRIPEKYKTRFMDIAKEEFANDYGLCLREMIRVWDGIFVDANDELKIKIDILADEIQKVKESLNVKKEEEKKDNVIMADGTVRKLNR